MEADFSGYATKAGLKCSDGRTITPEAFKHQDKMTVPLVWQHGHTDPGNILGHAVLEARPDGMYCRAFFNDTDQGKNAKALVQHKDITQLSIWANQLIEKAKQVLHGSIKEVSLVLSGANPGALIDYVAIAHADGSTDIADDEAIIYTGLSLAHDDSSNADAGDGSEDGPTIQDVYDSMSQEQKDVVAYMIGAAVTHSEEGGEGSDEKKGDEKKDGAEGENADGDDKKGADGNSADGNKDEGDLEHQEGNDMSRNVFDQTGGAGTKDRPTLTHDQLKTIVEDAKKMGSFKESFLAHAGEYGITDIDLLFPDAKSIQNAPELIARRQEWVSGVISGAKKSPFSRIKTRSADITADEARAKGYVKGNLKKEEWFGLTQRVTTPTTIYKKQKLDRDDIIDITDLDVVAWLKGEMRLMLDEEIARAALIGDGREVDDEDKIDETHIRPIAFDDDFYTHKVIVDANVDPDALIEAVLRARKYYRGQGNPTAYTTEDILTDMLLVKDRFGRRLYPTAADVATAMRVSNIVTVPVMENVQTDDGELQMVLVNMSDYTMGADKGGSVTMFDDFDIDYNQYKYLIETRMSGCLTGFKTAMAIVRTNGTEVTPGVPTFVAGTGVVTIPATANVKYYDEVTDPTHASALTAGAQTALDEGATMAVVAVPDAGYYFPHNTDDDWNFTRPSA